MQHERLWRSSACLTPTIEACLFAPSLLPHVPTPRILGDLDSKQCHSLGTSPSPNTMTVPNHAKNIWKRGGTICHRPPAPPRTRHGPSLIGVRVYIRPRNPLEALPSAFLPRLPDFLVPLSFLLTSARHQGRPYTSPGICMRRDCETIASHGWHSLSAVSGGGRCLEAVCGGLLVVAFRGGRVSFVEGGEAWSTCAIRRAGLVDLCAGALWIVCRSDYWYQSVGRADRGAGRPGDLSSRILV